MHVGDSQVKSCAKHSDYLTISHVAGDYMGETLWSLFFRNSGSESNYLLALVTSHILCIVYMIIYVFAIQLSH